jgi:hypothetical protein
MNITTSYTLSGDASETINGLMAFPPEGSSDLSSLSSNNYPTSNTIVNPDNQHVFMNQPLSWWLAGLNAGTIKYTPVSNNVNWSYTDASGTSFHISRTLTNIIIPNRTLSATRDPVSNKTTIVFEEKHGMNRTDVHSM